MKTPFTGVSIFILLVASSFTFAQGRLKNTPSKRPTAHASKPVAMVNNESFESPTGKLAVSGMHTGVIGILQIHIDSSLKGPVVITVSNNGQIVKQGEERAQIVQLKLTRATDYKQQVDLADGENVVQVSDLGDSAEKVTFAWRGEGLAKPESMSNTRAVATSDTLPAVNTPGAATAPPSLPPPPPSEIKQSGTGKLTVTVIYTDLTAKVSVDVDADLEGPFEIKVTDANGAVVSTTEKVLHRRGNANFYEEMSLVAGSNQITVRSKAAGEGAESVVMTPWNAVAPTPKPPDSFKPNDFEVSPGGNVSASLTRINGSVNLKFSITDKVDSLEAVFLDTNNKELFSRRYPDLRSGDWSVNLSLPPGSDKITVTARLRAGGTDSVDLDVPAEANLKPLESASEDPPEYDWGRVRGYFAGGVIFSKEREDFSKSDIFLDFTLDKNYLGRKHMDVNTFFNARLTSVPVTAKDTTEPAEGEDTEPCNTPDCTAFITSKKAAMMQAGIYIPMYADFMTWRREVPRLNRPSRLERNALFIAPLAKGGIVTVTGDRETAEAKQFGADDVFNFYSFGAMLGHFRLHTRETADGWDINPDVAPELISWLTISAGRWENFEIEVPSGQKNAMGEDILVRRRPWRIEALGRLKIPETPFLIGFDGNFGKGPDDVRFLFGTRFDIGKILHTLRVAAAQDKLGK
jgi:hypothetical protein